MKRYSLDEVPDLRGKTYLITGGNAGIGFACANHLCAKGAHVVLGCRDKSRGHEAMGRLQSTWGEAAADFVGLDLSSLDSIQQCVQEVQAWPQLDGLVNNAGIVTSGDRLGALGFDLRFETNHLGHWALTGLLVDKLVESNARVVTVSSMTYRTISANWQSAQTGGGEFYGGYALSKLANLVFALELNRRAVKAGLPLMSIACHPGAVDTNMIANYVPRLYPLAKPLISLLLNSPEGGALPLLRGVADPRVRGGEFFAPQGPAEWAGGADAVKVRKLEEHLRRAAGLWAMSEKATNIKIL